MERVQVRMLGVMVWVSLLGTPACTSLPAGSFLPTSEVQAPAEISQADCEANGDFVYIPAGE